MNEEEKKVVEHLKETSKDRMIIPLDDEILIAVNLIEKLQKENEELKADNYELNNIITDLLENIPIQKVKDKIEEELPLIIVGGRKNKKTLEYGIKLGRRQVLQELIEESEEK